MSRCQQNIIARCWKASGTQHLFDGVNLTEQQRQQCVTYHQARKDLPDINVEQLETMHRLVTAGKFDQSCACTAELMDQNRWIAGRMARIRNQCLIC